MDERPEDMPMLLASQRPGSFDADEVEFVCWHEDDLQIAEYRIAQILIPS